MSRSDYYAIAVICLARISASANFLRSNRVTRCSNHLLLSSLQLSSHTGWADLANYVLRTHLCLDIPSDGTCGLLVDGEVSTG